MNGLVLSVFPGIDLLGRAFEEEGYCVVRGPDVLWGGDIHGFHPPAGVFEGVIGGPPCQAFSQLIHIIRANGHQPRHGNLIPEFERVVAEAQPAWFLMENVEAAPAPVIHGFLIQNLVLNNRWVGGVQNRKRRFSFGATEGQWIDPETELFEPVEWDYAVTCDARMRPVRIGGSGYEKRPRESGGRTSALNRRPPGGGIMPHVGKARPFAEMCELQGLPADFLEDAPFTMHGKRQVVGNAVPMPMGRAVAKAVKKAIKT